MPRIIKIYALVVFAIFASIMLAPVVAFAQENTSINVGQLLAPWLEMLVGAVAILITALLGWITAMIKQKTGIDIEARHREALQTALTNAAGLVISRVQGSIADVDFDVRHALVKDAILYVNQAAPDAVERFGLTPQDIAEKLTAKLGLVAPK